MNKQKTNKSLAMFSMSLMVLMLASIFATGMVSAIRYDDVPDDIDLSTSGDNIAPNGGTDDIECPEGTIDCGGTQVYPDVLPVRPSVQVSLPGSVGGSSSGGGGSYPSNAYFIGTGFLFNEDETAARFIDLKIIQGKEDSVSGKITFGGLTFRLEGIADGRDIEFEVSTPYSEKTMNFQGEMRSYEDVKILKGVLKGYDGEKYKLTASSHKNSGIKTIIVPEGKTITRTFSVGMPVEYTEDSVEIASSELDYAIGAIPTEILESGETYIRPVEIKKPTIFGFIPNPWGKNKIVIEIVEDGQILEATITAGSSEVVGSYVVSVPSSLEDATNVELEITNA